jgi:methyl-accepting chemotaxis protein
MPDMTPQQVALVQSSWSRVAPIAPAAAELFYQTLFARHPGLRVLFGADIAAQGVRLMAMIGGGVQLLSRPGQLEGVLRDLGARHAGYGVREAHYNAVGEALIDTLAAGLGEHFTTEVRSAWGAFYAAVAQAMIAGARAAAPMRSPAPKLAAAG